MDKQLFLNVHQFLHLLYKPSVDAGAFMQILDGCAFAQRFVHLKLALAGGRVYQDKQVFEGQPVEVSGESQAMTPLLEGTNGLMQRLLVIFTDAHHLAHGPHLGAKFIFDSLKLLEGPTREFDHDIIARRRIFFKRTVAPVRYLVKGQSTSKHGRNHGNGEPGRFRGERARTRGARVDLDDHHAPGFWIVGHLHVRTANYLYGLDDVVSVFLEPLLQFLGHGEHGRGAERVDRMHAHGVHILNETHGNHLVFRVAHHLELEFFPTEHGFFYKHLAHHAGGKAASNHGLQLLLVVYQSAASAAHGIGRTQDNRISKTRRDSFGFFNAVGQLAAGHFDTQLGHGLLEGVSVLAALDSVQVHPNNLDVKLIEYPRLGQLRRQIQAGLTTKIGQ